MKYIVAVAMMCFAMYTHSGTLLTPQIVGNTIIANNPAEECLALNVYYEARSDNMAGMYAVANVVLNRVADKRYPDTICGVVKQGRMGDTSGIVKLHRCQFSWYCDGKKDYPTEEDSWQKAQIVAYNLLNHRKFRGITEGATHYHAHYVSPNWASELDLIGTIGQHAFYRWE
jgi:spore germination cell wall hydrolase CwlJ-like protein